MKTKVIYEVCSVPKAIAYLEEDVYSKCSKLFLAEELPLLRKLTKHKEEIDRIESLYDENSKKFSDANTVYCHHIRLELVPDNDKDTYKKAYYITIQNDINLECGVTYMNYEVSEELYNKIKEIDSSLFEPVPLRPLQAYGNYNFHSIISEQLINCLKELYNNIDEYNTALKIEVAIFIKYLKQFMEQAIICDKRVKEDGTGIEYRLYNFIFQDGIKYKEKESLIDIM